MNNNMILIITIFVLFLVFRALNIDGTDTGNKRGGSSFSGAGGKW